MIPDLLPNLIFVLVYGVLCAALGILVDRTYTAYKKGAPLMRKPDPVLLVQLGVAVIAAAVAVGIDVGFRLDQPATITRTEWVDVPPACLDALDAARDEQAHTATEHQHETLLADLAADRYAAQLTRDDDTIADAAEALDAENRLVQQAALDAGAAAAAFNTAAAACEADQ